jgi:hypothetical protein
VSPNPAPPAAWGEPAVGWAEQAGPGWDDQTVTQYPQRPFQAPLPPPTRPQDSPYAPPAYDGPSYGQAPQHQQGYEPFQPYEPPAPSLGPPSGPFQGPPSVPFQGPPRQPPRRHDRNRSGTPLAVWIIVLVILLGGGAAAGLLIAHPFSHPSLRDAASTGGTPTASAGTGSATASPAATASTTPASSPSASASATAVTEQQAATTVATMLQQSVSDRAGIDAAYDNVMNCNTAQMGSAPTVFTDAANSRQKLLASLGTMTGRAALPPALLSDLTQAWQASIAADQAFAQWASDELASCTPNDTSSPAYLATDTPDANATKYKTAFVALWNPIATQYGLTTYAQDQL